MADNFEHEELDFFEANNTFKEMLKRNLSASQIARITDFAYQYSAYADTLFSTLMEVLQETPVLQRLNCFYVIDNIFKHKLKANSDCYFIPIKANLEQIVYIVIDCQPNALENDKSIQSEGFVNVASVKKVLALWKLKKLISPGRHDDLAAFLTSCSELASR